MKSLRLFLLGVASGVVLAACGGSVPSTTEPSSAGSGSISQQQAGLPRRACPKAAPDEAQCDVVVIKTGVQPDLAGWGPSDLQAAYNLPSSTRGSGQLVAIVDAYDNPNVASDLAAYRAHFGLPATNFTKYNQDGQTSNYPPSCTGQDNWCIEIDLDVEMVSAICPNCTIDLIESNTNSLRNLDTAEREAVTLGAHIVSNSWGCYSPGCRWRTHAFESPGVVYLAASGDIHYGSYEPARLANVISVGGTVLAKNGSKYKENVWAWTSGGCAKGVPKPSWQHDPGCKSRTANDVAAVAWDVAEYDTYGSYSGWFTVGGTSIATPILASIYALAGNASSQDAGKTFWTLTKQQRTKYLHVITEGSNGACHKSYLCTAGTGQYSTYSGPTGWGTPNGIGAF
ncbi:MAG: S8 family serine peptidase [Candidatus Cybelea sp.]